MLQAGDVNTGEFDDFAELVPLAKEHGAWVHIDGAFGLWAAASPKLRHLVRGVELADSWATDGHKWLNVPYDCGYAFVADTAAHRASMSQKAAYLTHVAEARDEMDWNPEFSRRGRGFATYAAIRQLGRSGVAELVERCCEHAHALVTRMGALPGAEMVWEPIINQGLVRFLDPAGRDDRRFYGADYGGDSGDRRGVFLRDDLARASGDAGECLQLADVGGGCGAGGAVRRRGAGAGSCGVTPSPLVLRKIFIR